MKTSNFNSPKEAGSLSSGAVQMPQNQIQIKTSLK